MTRHHLPSLHLNPGELYIGKKPALISTILGSCVAVVMFHPTSAIGAICHSLLPDCQCHEEPCLGKSCRDCFRYVDCSVVHMVNWFRDQGAPPWELQVKLFGGSDMFDHNMGDRSVGQQNIRIAREVIEKEGMRLLALDVGGNRGRKIIFNSMTGEVFMKRLRSSQGQALKAG